MILYASHYRKRDGASKPISLAELSRESPSRRENYFGEVIYGVNHGGISQLSTDCAAFMATITGKDIDFWRRISYTLAEAESIQITLPSEISPAPTVSVPARAERGVTPKEIPTARDLAKAVLFPEGLTSTTIAPRMKPAAKC